MGAPLPPKSVARRFRLPVARARAVPALGHRQQAEFRNFRVRAQALGGNPLAHKWVAYDVSGFRTV